jgi:hypothetical protein
MSKPAYAAAARSALARSWARADASYPRLSRAVLFLLATAAMWLVFGGGWLGLLVEASLIVLAVAYWTRLSQLWADSAEPGIESGPAELVGYDEASEGLYLEAPGPR